MGKRRYKKKNFIISTIILLIIIPLIFIAAISVSSHKEKEVKDVAIELKDTDIDGDGFFNDIDLFPNDPDEWNDTDGDGVGDNNDEFPLDPNEFSDRDGDGVGDNSDDYPYDPDSYEDGDPVWTPDGYLYPYKGKDIWVEVSEIHGRIDYFSWNLTASEPIDIHVMDPNQQTYFADQEIGSKGRFEIDMIGTWQVVFVYTKCNPPRSQVIGECHIIR